MSIFSAGTGAGAAGGGGSLAAVHYQSQPSYTRPVYALPDFDLSSLQNRIQIKDLEHLYKRYEQRAQIGELEGSSRVGSNSLSSLTLRKIRTY